MVNRRTPFDLFEEMERFMNQFQQNRWGAQSHWDVSTPVGGVDVDFTHGTNVSLEQTDVGFTVLADIPGFEKEDIDLRFDDGVLHIDASRRVEGEGYSRSRRVSEHVSIPDDVVVEEIGASYRNGVLQVTLPVAAAAEDAHRIDID